MRALSNVRLSGYSPQGPQDWGGRNVLNTRFQLGNEGRPLLRAGSTQPCARGKRGVMGTGLQRGSGLGAGSPHLSRGNTGRRGCPEAGAERPHLGVTSSRHWPIRDQHRGEQRGPHAQGPQSRAIRREGDAHGNSRRESTDLAGAVEAKSHVPHRQRPRARGAGVRASRRASRKCTWTPHSAGLSSVTHGSQTPTLSALVGEAARVDSF